MRARRALRAASATHLRGIQRHFAAALPADEIAPVRRFLDRLLAPTPATPADACDVETPPDSGC